MFISDSVMDHGWFSSLTVESNPAAGNCPCEALKLALSGLFKEEFPVFLTDCCAAKQNVLITSLFPFTTEHSSSAADCALFWS